MQMILSGEPVDAATARRIGLVHRVVPRADLDAEAARLAEQLAALPPDYVATVKEAVREGLDLPLPLALTREAELVAMLPHVVRT